MKINRVPSGIPGLDVVLNGGFQPESIYLVEGVPGAGKTTFGMQYIHSGIIEHDEQGLIITFEEFPEQLERDARTFGWDLRALQKQGRLAIMSTSPDTLMSMMEEPGGPIDQMANGGALKRVLVDSITHFQLAIAESAELRRMVSTFMNGLRRLGVTALLTKEIERDDPQSIPFEEYLVDGVIRLTNSPLGPFRRTRCLEIIKSRGQPHLSGRSGFRFGNQGIEVFPRLSSTWAAHSHWRPEAEAAMLEERGELSVHDRPVVPAADPDGQRVSTGIVGLDQMFYGGLLQGSSALIAGTSGTGKTLLCLQFLHAGLKQGEPGVFLTVEENVTKLIHSARVIGLDLEPYVANGLLHIESHTPADTTSGESLWHLYRRVRETGAKRVIVDSLSALFGSEYADTGMMQNATQHLMDLLEAMDITALLTWEIQDITGDLRISDHGLSAVVDTLVLLRYVETGSEMKRIIGVMKSRGTDHDNQLREFRIGSDGIHVEAKLIGLSDLLRGSARGTPKETVEELVQPLVYIQDVAGMLQRREIPPERVQSALNDLVEEADRVSQVLRDRLAQAAGNTGASP